MTLIFAGGLEGQVPTLSSVDMFSCFYFVLAGLMCWVVRFFFANRNSQAAYFQRINLSAQGFYTVPAARCGYDFDLETSNNRERGFPFNYFTQVRDRGYCTSRCPSRRRGARCGCC